MKFIFFTLSILSSSYLYAQDGIEVFVPFLWALLGMVLAFVAIYLYLSSKIRGTDLTSDLKEERNFSSQYQLLKQKLTDVQRRNNIIKQFSLLNDKDRDFVIEKLNEKYESLKKS